MNGIVLSCESPIANYYSNCFSLRFLQGKGSNFEPISHVTILLCGVRPTPKNGYKGLLEKRKPAPINKKKESESSVGWLFHSQMELCNFWLLDVISSPSHSMSLITNLPVNCSFHPWRAIRLHSVFIGMVDTQLALSSVDSLYTQLS